MPYLILVFGVIAAVFAAYHLFTKLSPQQIKYVLRYTFILIIGVALIFLALTGRVVPAVILGIVAILSLYPFTYKRKKNAEDTDGRAEGQVNQKSHEDIMGQEEAREILGLDEGYTKTDVKNAYKRLMQKIHPDHDGSAGLARKLNEACDTLLKHFDD